MTADRCAECGFDGERLTTEDAVVALRSALRRWREAFARVAEEQVLHERPQPGAWSALEHAAYARDVIGALADSMDRILTGERPSLSPPVGVDEWTDHVKGGDPQAALAGLERHVNRVARRADEVGMHTAWDRTGTLDGDEVSAGQVLRKAVHTATHHLRQAQRLLERLT